MTDEILVHISAPTTRQNDEFYRSLADAYSAFEPGRTLGGEPLRQENGPDGRPNTGNNAPNVSNDSGSTHAAAGTSILSMSKDSYGSFPSYPSFEERGKAQELASTQEIGSSEDGGTPPSSRLARLESIHTEWKQQKTSRPSMLNETSLLSTNLEDGDAEFIEDTQLAAQALQSQLQDVSFSISRETHLDEHETESEAGKDYISDVNGDSESSCQSTVESVSGTLDFTLLQVDAFPPAPNISVVQPGTLPSQATADLVAIKKQNPTRFKPSKSLYSPKVDDRGYWLIESSTWPPKIQCEFWSALCKLIENGRLGWGVTLYRENGSRRALGRSKLYCWGELVEHTWLVLWLCSQGKISGTGSQWFDADGVAAISMS